MLTIRNISVVTGDTRGVAAAAGYVLEVSDSPGHYFPDARQRANTMWLGSDAALAALGLERGREVVEADLAAALQGLNARTGERARKEGMVWSTVKDEHGLAVRDKHGALVKERAKGCTSADMTFSVPKELSAAYVMAPPDHKPELEHAIIAAAYAAVEHAVQTKNVVRRNGAYEPARGVVAAFALHVTARRAEGELVPSPQVHVHCIVTGVERSDGKLAALTSRALYKDSAMLEAAAVGRANLAHRLVMLGYRIRGGTGRKRRFFEVRGVSKALVKAWSGRTREVLQRVAELERQWGGTIKGAALGMVAYETRQGKDKTISGEEIARIWSETVEEIEHGHHAGAALRGPPGYRHSPEERRKKAAELVLERLAEAGPTVTVGQALALVYEVAPGLLSDVEARELVDELERSGTLVMLEENRVTSREIRAAERRVLSIAKSAAERGDAPVSERAQEHGIAIASASLGKGLELDGEQKDAVRLLTSGAGWTILTGLAGTGKGPTLEAVAKAYEADGWRVIASGPDGATAQLMAKQTGGEARTLESLTQRVNRRSLRLEEKPTVVLIDEASKVDLRYWLQLAAWTVRHRIRVIAVGHEGQHGAIELPGMFSALLRAIPAAELEEVRRHREQWLRDHQIALNQGDGTEAVRLLAENGAMAWYDTRKQAIKGIVNGWDAQRLEHNPGEVIMLVHGSNVDVDEMNALAQARRVREGELVPGGIQAPDRDYQLHVNDVVVLRGAPFQPGGDRVRRVENGQGGFVTAVDAANDTVDVFMKEPGHEPRTVRFHLRQLRERVEAGEKIPALRLAYAIHTFPAQGITEEAAHVLYKKGQGKESTYVGNTRSRGRLMTYLAREDFGVEGSDEDREKRLAKDISISEARHASIKYEVDESARLTHDPVLHRHVPWLPERGSTDVSVEEVLDTGSAEPLEPYRVLLGDERVALLATRAEALLESLADKPDEWLREQRDTYAAAWDGLKPDTARHAARLQRDQQEAAVRIRQAMGEASRLRAEAGKLKKLSERDARADLLEAAGVQVQLAEKDRAEHFRLGAVARALAENPAHPDRWLEEQGENAARWAALQSELAARHAGAAEIDQDRVPEQIEEPELAADAELPAPGADEPSGPGLAA